MAFVSDGQTIEVTRPQAPQGQQAKKRKRVPDTHVLRKRPPTRPAIASPYANASTPKVVYVSSKMPFMSAVKRVRQLLTLADKRSLGRINLGQKSSDRHMLDVLAQEKARKARGESEPVFIKGTGKAIDKVLQLALFFQGQPDCSIQVQTGTLDVVDDIIEKDEGFDVEQDESMVVDTQDLPDLQHRTLSVLEIRVQLR